MSELQRIYILNLSCSVLTGEEEVLRYFLFSALDDEIFFCGSSRLCSGVVTVAGVSQN